MRLVHISPSDNILTLTPQVSPWRLAWEPEEAAVCAAPEWWQALLLAPRRKGAPAYVYQVVDPSPFVSCRGGGWIGCWWEWRAYQPVPVRLLGRIRQDVVDAVRAMGFCSNCWGPMAYCQGQWCDTPLPALEEVLE